MRERFILSPAGKNISVAWATRERGRMISNSDRANWGCFLTSNLTSPTSSSGSNGTHLFAIRTEKEGNTAKRALERLLASRTEGAPMRGLAARVCFPHKRWNRSWLWLEGFRDRRRQHINMWYRIAPRNFVNWDRHWSHQFNYWVECNVLSKNELTRNKNWRLDIGEGGGRIIKSLPLSDGSKPTIYSTRVLLIVHQTLFYIMSFRKH